LQRLALIICLFTLGVSAKVNFSREVRPILSDTCFQCHGPDESKRMAKLRLDTKDGAMTVVTPGNAAASKLVIRITHDKTAMRMPPAASGLKLTAAQIATLKEWIDEGAPWNNHWSFDPPQRLDPPAVALQAWPRNSIDNFVLARLEKEGLQPSPAADKATLLRRVSLDLTGLPPTTAELDAFLADKSPAAYEKQVDRLLSSPRYGERMALFWLDLARYADSHGYHIDSHRDMWPWRDWVIRAFNANLPYDQFARYQLAGDLLPEPTRDTLIATGFNRNHMINYEGGAIPEEYQNEYVVDRVDTTSNVFLGLTMGCARCHDHKYDPIRQKDFYQFGAFFNTIPEKGLDGRAGNAEPVLRLPTPDQAPRWKAVDTAMIDILEVLNDPDVAAAQSAWETARAGQPAPSPTNGLTAWYELDASLSDLSGHFRSGRIRSGDVNYAISNVNRGADFDGQTHVEWGSGILDTGKPFALAAWLRDSRQLERQAAFRIADGSRLFEIAFTPSEALPRLQRGAHLIFRLASGTPGEALEIRTRERLRLGTSYHVVLNWDGSGRPAGLRVWIDGQPVDLDIISDTLPGPVSLNGLLETGNSALGERFKGRIDDLRFYDRPVTPAEIDRLALHYPIDVLLSTTPPSRRNKDQDRQVRAYYFRFAAPEPLRQAAAEYKELDDQREDLEFTTVSTMVMKEALTPRDTYVLARGDYSQPKEKVTAAVPASLPPLPPGRPANRLTLADWLLDPNHPLTSRVAVNRFWQMVFGIGLVKTSEDFGSQGEPPSNPELLDWLATEFVRTNWDVKGILKLLVTSSTYRQSSKVSKELHDRDPENRLLARGPRARLQAELVRDNALAVSGLLSSQIGGPSVLPYQPAGLWEELAFGDVYSYQTYVQDHGDKLYRRSMYTFWKRTAPPATLTIFDAPDREKCASRRPVTNTPLQALALLNDPTYVESARALAQRTIKEAGPSPDQRLRFAFRLATARYPDARELAVLRAAYQKQSSIYSADPQSAAKLLTIGESVPDAAIPPPQLAAWTNVCSIILNLDETITKE
jgi:hypothetical protein